MSITGTWNLTLKSPLGDRAARLDLHELDGSVQGTLTGKGAPFGAFEFSGNRVWPHDLEGSAVTCRRRDGGPAISDA